MEVWIVCEGNSGYCIGVYTTEKRALIAKAIRERNGYPCRDPQLCIVNRIEEEEDGPQDEE